MARRLGQDVQVKAHLQQLVLVMPVDDGLEVHQGRCRVEDHVLGQRRGLADAVLAPNPKLEGAVGDDLAAEQLGLRRELPPMVGVDVPVVPRLGDILTQQERVQRAARLHDLTARRLVYQRDNAPRLVEADLRMRRLDGTLANHERRPAPALGLAQRHRHRSQRRHAQPRDREPGVPLHISHRLADDAVALQSQPLRHAVQHQLAGPVPTQCIDHQQLLRPARHWPRQRRQRLLRDRLGPRDAAFERLDRLIVHTLNR